MSPPKSPFRAPTTSPPKPPSKLILRHPKPPSKSPSKLPPKSPSCDEGGWVKVLSRQKSKAANEMVYIPKPSLVPVKKKNKCSLNVESKYLSFGTNRQELWPKPRWYNVTLGNGRSQPQVWIRKTRNNRYQASPLGEDWHLLKWELLTPPLLQAQVEEIYVTTLDVYVI